MHIHPRLGIEYPGERVNATVDAACFLKIIAADGAEQRRLQIGDHAAAAGEQAVASRARASSTARRCGSRWPLAIGYWKTMIDRSLASAIREKCASAICGDWPSVNGAGGNTRSAEAPPAVAMRAIRAASMLPSAQIPLTSGSRAPILSRAMSSTLRCSSNVHEATSVEWALMVMAEMGDPNAARDADPDSRLTQGSSVNKNVQCLRDHIATSEQKSRSRRQSAKGWTGVVG